MWIVLENIVSVEWTSWIQKFPRVKEVSFLPECNEITVASHQQPIRPQNDDAMDIDDSTSSTQTTQNVISYREIQKALFYASFQEVNSFLTRTHYPKHMFACWNPGLDYYDYGTIFSHNHLAVRIWTRNKHNIWNCRELRIKEVEQYFHVIQSCTQLLSEAILLYNILSYQWRISTLYSTLQQLRKEISDSNMNVNVNDDEENDGTAFIHTTNIGTNTNTNILFHYVPPILLSTHEHRWESKHLVLSWFVEGNRDTVLLFPYDTINRRKTNTFTPQKVFTVVNESILFSSPFPSPPSSIPTIEDDLFNSYLLYTEIVPDAFIRKNNPFLISAASSTPRNTSSSLLPLLSYSSSSSSSSVMPSSIVHFAKTYRTGKIDGPVSLPCFIETKFNHLEFGQIHVIALLWWADDESNDNTLNRPSDFERYMDNSFFESEMMRVCYFHRIFLVQPLYSPLQTFVDCFFSSFNASLECLGNNESGWKGWNILGHPEMTMSRVVASHGFINTRMINSNIPDVYTSYADVILNNNNQKCNNALVREITFRDMMAISCKFECNEHLCNPREVDISAEEDESVFYCTHGIEHEPYHIESLEKDNMPLLLVSKESKKVKEYKQNNHNHNRKAVTIIGGQINSVASSLSSSSATTGDRKRKRMIYSKKTPWVARICFKNVPIQFFPFYQQDQVRHIFHTHLNHILSKVHPGIFTLRLNERMLSCDNLDHVNMYNFIRKYYQPRCAIPLSNDAKNNNLYKWTLQITNEKSISFRDQKTIMAVLFATKEFVDVYGLAALGTY